jgi:hypothetical protein
VTRILPYTWRVGVDNAFGYLTRPDGRAHLAESRRFYADLGIAVSLHDGSVLLTAATGQSTWQRLPPGRACELAGIPGAAVDGEAETARRLDPFHVERQTSGTFNAIVAVAVERHLPCGHALRAWRGGLWNGTFDGAYLEAPETFAASVLEQMAATDTPLADALREQLAQDAILDPASSQHHQMMSDTGWQTALTETHSRAQQIAGVIAQRRQSHRDAALTAGDQLALI